MFIVNRTRANTVLVKVQYCKKCVQPLPSLEKSATTINEKLLEALSQAECVAHSNLHCGETPSRRTVPLQIDNAEGRKYYQENFVHFAEKLLNTVLDKEEHGYLFLFS